MKSRQLVAIVIIIVVAAATVNFIRQDADWPLPRVLPGCDGLPLSPIHFLAGAVLIFFMLWGLRRLRRSSDDTEACNTKPDDTDGLQDDADDHNTYEDTNDNEEG